MFFRFKSVQRFPDCEFLLCHRAQRLVGADVRRGLFAADVLFARLQSQHKGALAAIVRGLADDAARQFAHQRLGRRHEAEVRPAEGERHAQRLPFAHGHVRADLAGRFVKRAGDGVDAQNQFGAVFVDDRRGLFPVLDGPK